MYSEWSKPYPHLNPGEPKENVLLLRFRDGAIRNERLSADGPAVYDRVFQVQVMAVGQKQSAPIYTLLKITEGKEKIEEPREHAQFKVTFDQWRANVEPSHEGTPLEHWPLMTTEIVRAFKDANVFTVEMLANAGDQVATAVRAPFYDWRTKAQAWLKDATERGGDAKARVQLSQANERIKALETQVQQLLAQQNGSAPAPAGFTAPKKARKAKTNGAEHVDLEGAAEFEEERI